MARQTAGKLLGNVSITFVLVSIPLNVVSGVGVFVALLGLIFAGVAVLSGVAKHAIVSLCIATASIFIISPLPPMQEIFSLPPLMLATILIPYLFVIVTLVLHTRKNKV